MKDRTATFTVTINATPEQVWPFVGDLGRMGEWSPKPYSVEWLSGEPNAAGSTFRSTGWLPNDKAHKMEGTVKLNEPMKTFEVVSHDENEEWTNRYNLTPAGSQTTVTKTAIGAAADRRQEARPLDHLRGVRERRDAEGPEYAQGEGRVLLGRLR